MAEQVDYLIVGQGLAGTFLSRALMNAGFSVRVIDQQQPFAASRVASGVINPVTGRRMVRTWEIETLMPFAVQTYTAFGKELGKELIRQCNILDFHPTPQMHLAFEERIPEEKEYLRRPADADQWQQYFAYPFGVGEIDPCWLIDLHTMLNGWRQLLQQKDALLDEWFDLQALSISAEGVQYKNIAARAVFFCDGISGFENP